MHLAFLLLVLFSSFSAAARHVSSTEAQQLQTALEHHLRAAFTPARSAEELVDFPHSMGPGKSTVNTSWSILIS
jgi:hypothetical protein